MISPFASTQESAWFKRFEAALSGLPTEDSREIVRELREHLHERISQGHDVEQMLGAFGDASAYARTFIDEYSLTRARDSRQTLRMFATVASFARRSLIACIGLLFASVFALLITSSLVCLTIKVVRPDRVGLWVDLPLGAQHRYVHSGPESIPLRLGRDHIQFGYSNPRPQAPEILGTWIYPCLLALALLGYMGLRFTLFRTLNKLSGRRG
ncbi:MAG: HAAS signaling domain-containing protein [Candidatus Korobacteraceae bacterium]